MPDSPELYECIHCGKLDADRDHWAFCPYHPARLRMLELRHEIVGREFEIARLKRSVRMQRHEIDRLHDRLRAVREAVGRTRRRTNDA